MRPPGSAVPGAGREGRVEHVDVDRQVGARRPRRGRARSRRARPRPMPRSTISPMVCQRNPASRIHWNSSGNGHAPRRPICTMFRPSRWPSTTAWWNGMPCGASRSSAAGVGVGVEVDDREAVRAERARRAASRTGVESEWSPPSTIGHRTRAQDLGHGAAQRRVRPGQVRRANVDVAVVDDVELRVRVDPELHVRPRDRKRDVLGIPDRARAEPRARAVAHALVERRADDRDVGALQAGGVRAQAGRARTSARHRRSPLRRGGWAACGARRSCARAIIRGWNRSSSSIPRPCATSSPA